MRNKVAVISIDVEDWYHLDYFDRSACDVSQSLLDGLDVYVDYSSDGSQQIRSTTSKGLELTSSPILGEQAQTVAVSYHAPNGELTLETIYEKLETSGAEWTTPTGSGIIGETYKGFISQIANFDIRINDLTDAAAMPASDFINDPSLINASDRISLPAEIKSRLVLMGIQPWPTFAIL